MSYPLYNSENLSEKQATDFKNPVYKYPIYIGYIYTRVWYSLQSIYGIGVM